MLKIVLVFQLQILFKNFFGQRLSSKESSSQDKNQELIYWPIRLPGVCTLAGDRVLILGLNQRNCLYYFGTNIVHFTLCNAKPYAIAKLEKFESLLLIQES